MKEWTSKTCSAPLNVVYHCFQALTNPHSQERSHTTHSTITHLPMASSNASRSSHRWTIQTKVYLTQVNTKKKNFLSHTHTQGQYRDVIPHLKRHQCEYRKHLLQTQHASPNLTLFRPLTLSPYLLTNQSLPRSHVTDQHVQTIQY